jgi:LemA protein
MITLRALFLGVVFVVVAVLPGCQKYDVLVEKNAVCDEKWSDIDAQLQRRYDLIPNLVATVKGSAAHEEKTLAEVTQARAAATQIKLTADDLTDPAKMAAFQKAQDDLKANAQFHTLQVELEGTENRILRAREEYNAAARDYNAELAKIGGQVVNKVTGKTFKPRVYFSASAAAQTAPTVSF